MSAFEEFWNLIMENSQQEYFPTSDVPILGIFQQNNLKRTDTVTGLASGKETKK